MKKIISTAAMLGLLRYARFSADPTAPVLTLDVVPSGEPGGLQVFFRKQLLAKAQVTVYAENGWEQNKLSDEQGQVRVSTPSPGRFHRERQGPHQLSSKRPRMQPDPIQLIQSNVGTSAVFRLLTLFTVIAALCAGGMVYGQDELGTRQETQGITTREPTTTPLAQAPPDEPKTFKIAPQALDGALIEFSAVTGIQVLVEGELTAGVASPGVSGSLPPEQALQRLLANSDLAYRFTSANIVTLEQAPADAGQAPITLPAITVTAAAESAFGPDEGYVANRSATATKTDTPLIETPQSISVVTRDRMEAQNAQSVSDALRYTAGVVAESNGPDPRSDEVTIRGIETASSGSQYRDGLRDFAFGGQGGIVMEPYLSPRLGHCSSHRRHEARNR